ncbi:MAG: L,D-transpeptidase family protein [Hyphomicrobiales bacterium]|nr:L,D-transpeptidase family protein [Hyphomicrobiales bacterium]
MEVDAYIGPGTVSAMNTPVEALIEKIRINMERWRWMPSELGKRYIMVNIAGFNAEAYEDGKRTVHMRAIVGKPYHGTPSFSSVITDVIFRPYWHVPSRIAREQILPALKIKPDFLKENGFQVLQKNDKDIFHIVDMEKIDWKQVSAEDFPYALRQLPGEKNALGYVRFSIQNKWEIFMHGTPDQNLFSNEARAFSSGCIRVEDPLQMAYFVMEQNEGYDRQKIENMYNGSDKEASQSPRRVALSEPLKIHVMYLTAWIDEDGTVQFRDDVYSRDEQLTEALG